jgi:hypothetical protein
MRSSGTPGRVSQSRVLCEKILDAPMQTHPTQPYTMSLRSLLALSLLGFGAVADAKMEWRKRSPEADDKVETLRGGILRVGRDAPFQEVSMGVVQVVRVRLVFLAEVRAVGLW